MISSPPAIQSQLGEAVAIIADSDFWERWQTLTQVCFWGPWRKRDGEVKHK